MGAPNLCPIPAEGDWAAVRKAIGVLSRRLGPGGAPYFAGLDVDVLSVDSLTIPGLSGVLQATAGVLSGSAAHSALATIGANDHHNQTHVLNGADHTVSGLTPGHFLIALTSSTFGFAAPAGVVADGTYTVGAKITPVTGNNGTITITGGVITAIQQAT